MKNSVLYIHNSNFNHKLANNHQVNSMIQAFRSNKIEIGLLAFGDNLLFKDNWNKNLKNIVLLKPIRNSYLRSVLLFLKFIKLKKNYNFVLTRDLISAYLIKKLFPKTKVIYELHDIPENNNWMKLFNKTFPKLNYLIVISEGLREELIKLGYSSKKIKILHDGVDLKKFDSNIKTDSARKKLKLDLKLKFYIYVGSFQKWKGFDTLLEVSKKLLSNERLLIIGGGEDEIKKLRLEYPNIIFRGYVENDYIPLYLKSSDILLLPNSGKEKISSNYTSPLKLFEYLVSKKPIVASNLKSIKNIVSNKEVCFFKADNSDDLLKAIRKITSNKKFKNDLVTNSYKLGRKHDWKSRAKEIYKLF